MFGFIEVLAASSDRLSFWPCSSAGACASGDERTCPVKLEVWPPPNQVGRVSARRVAWASDWSGSAIMVMMESPAEIGTALSFVLISRNIERVADLACNIGEDVVYLVEGKTIRHPGVPHR